MEGDELHAPKDWDGTLPETDGTVEWLVGDDLEYWHAEVSKMAAASFNALVGAEGQEPGKVDKMTRYKARVVRQQMVDEKVVETEVFKDTKEQEADSEPNREVVLHRADVYEKTKGLPVCELLVEVSSCPFRPAL